MPRFSYESPPSASGPDLAQDDGQCASTRTEPDPSMKRQRTAYTPGPEAAPTATAQKLAAVTMADLPTDVLPLIFANLTDRRDLHACALSCKTFNAAATPSLYRVLDSRVIPPPGDRGQPRVLHPVQTIAKKPEYARYVRTVRETGAARLLVSELMDDYYKVIRQCVNIESAWWTDDADTANNDHFLLTMLGMIRTYKLKQLVIRTYLDLSEEVWAKVYQLRGLCKVSIWTMEGPPRILQGWSESLGPSLTDLELGRCAGVPASILVSVFSHLSNLQSLRLKGAPTSAIIEILTFLPRLVILDTEYFGSAVSRYLDVPVASLRSLTVRTSSVDLQGPQQLWTWIKMLLPRPSLESFTLNTFSMSGDATMPRRFLLDLAYVHRETLRHFSANSAMLTLEDIECVCTLFPMLETLSCSVALCQDGSRLEDAIANGHNLRELRLYTSWIPSRYGSQETEISFNVEHARRMMLRESSPLRIVGIGRDLYTGRWVKSDSQDDLQLKVVRDFVGDS